MTIPAGGVAASGGALLTREREGVAPFAHLRRIAKRGKARPARPRVAAVTPLSPRSAAMRLRRAKGAGRSLREGPPDRQAQTMPEQQSWTMAMSESTLWKPKAR